MPDAVEIRTPRELRRLVLLLQVASAVGSMNYGVMFTMLDDFRDKLNVPESQLGMVVGAGFIASFVGNILVAPLADKGHAKRLVLLGLVMQFVGALTMGFGHTFALLFLGRLLGGFGGGAAGPAMKRIIIVTSPGDVGHNLGRIVAADVVGFSVGPLVSALLVGRYGIPAPFLVVVAIVVPAFILLARRSIPEVADGDAPSQKFAFDLLRIRPIAGVTVMGTALMIMIGTFDSLWSIMMKDLDAAAWIASVGITVFALPMVFLAPVGGRLTQRHGPFLAMIVGFTSGAVFMVLYGVLPSPHMMLAVGCLHGIVDGLTITGGSSALSMVAPPERLASAQGVYSGVQILAGGIAASVAGATYERIGRGAFVTTAMVMALFLVVGAWLAKDHLRTRG